MKVLIQGEEFDFKICNDSTRNGDIDIGNTSDWTWGKDGVGAIILADNHSNFLNKEKKANLKIIEQNNKVLPYGYKLLLRTQENIASKFTIYRLDNVGKKSLLGVDLRNPYYPPRLISFPLRLDEDLYVTTGRLPDKNFDGLIPITLVLIDHYNNILASDTVVFRVAPWLMLPNTFPVEEVYTCQVKPGEQYSGNEKFVEDLSAILKTLDCKLSIIPGEEYESDMWIQDEMEIGFCENPDRKMHVVFDSPRDRGLDAFPETLIASNFGHFQIGRKFASGLDSFGNLEVSPPVAGYPFGRIICGGSAPHAVWSYPYPREMMDDIRAFLDAQHMQKPIKIFTDWLVVGHVDEVICFIPYEEKFKLLIVSPNKTKTILEELHKIAEPLPSMFQGKTLPDGKSAEKQVSELLGNNDLKKANELFQYYIDYNRTLLQYELGITEEDIIDIPALFYNPPDIPDDPNLHPDDQLKNDWRTVSYLPNMVNHLVIGNHSLVPKPHGFVVQGQDVFEKAFEEAMPSSQKVHFIDDWDAYHKHCGNIHCGTNVKRKPLFFPWWYHRPAEASDYYHNELHFNVRLVP